MHTFSIIFLVLPLVTFIFISIYGRKLGTYGSITISLFNILAVMLYSVFVLLGNSINVVESLRLWTWVSNGQIQLPFSITFDNLTSIMFVVVNVVSMCVHFYSTVYMYTDPFLSRFLSYLSLFTFFMLLLVSANGLLVLFIGWEGVGLCSYLLISFWYTRAQAGKAATKAFLINKIGDLFLLTGISLLFMMFNSVEVSTLSIISLKTSKDLAELVLFFLLVGVAGKSAQLGLHAWLPDAMEGPTPVSALIHAATMVTAGIFLVIRTSYLFEFSQSYLIIVAFWGGITALVSGTIGLVANDIKKIIAYSTCSQLGYMMLSCGVSEYHVALFHLFNHAFFKALLFLSAGSIIHLIGDQDIRKMGGFASLSPLVYLCIMLASLALAGFPFLAGFYSKDFIIEIALSKFWVNQQIFYWLSIISASLTVMYSIRLLEQVFWGDFTGFKTIIKKHTKSTIIEFGILSLLCLLSLASGFIFKDYFVGLGTDFFSSTTYITGSSWSLIDLEFLAGAIKALPLVLGLFAVEFQHSIFEYRWYFNELNSGSFVIPVLVASRQAYEQVEKRFIESGPTLWAKIVTKK